MDHRYRPGPLVWVAVVLATCLLLVLFQKVLWLVIPFLFALIAYYLVLPLKQRMVLAGVSHDTAAITVSLGILSVLGVVMLFSMPWLTAHASALQSGGGRYFEGGCCFFQKHLPGSRPIFRLPHGRIWQRKPWPV